MLKLTEPSERIETDPWVDNYVPTPEGEEQYSEVATGRRIGRTIRRWDAIGGRRWARWAIPAGHGEWPCRRFFWTPYGLHAGICVG